MTVIIAYSSIEIKRQYAMVEEAYSQLIFLYEGTKTTFASILKQAVQSVYESRSYLLWGVDDAFWMQKYSLDEAIKFLNKKDSLAFHFKLNPNVCFCHPRGSSMLPLPPLAPELNDRNGAAVEALRFQWKKGRLDWSYPWDLCGTMYTLETVQWVLTAIEGEFGEIGISHPNHLEEKGNGVLAGAQEKTRDLFCACPAYPIMAVLTINRVQSVYENAFYEHPEGSVSHLNSLLETKGMILDTDEYQKSRYSSVHIGDFKKSIDTENKVSMQPKVSIIMPVAQAHKKFLAKAVQSIVDQIYQSWELIIVLDGPQDEDIVSLVQEFVFSDDRVRYLANEKSCGIASCLNLGFFESEGKYIARMDADDISLPSRLLKQVQFMESNSDIQVIGCAVAFIDKNGVHTGKALVYPTDRHFVHWKMLFGCQVAHPTVLIRRSILLKLQYDENIAHAEDFDLWLRVLNLHPASIANLGDVLLLYRKHPGSVSSQNRFDQHARSIQISEKGISLAIDKTDRGFSSISRSVKVIYDSSLSNSLGEIQDAVKLIHLLRESLCKDFSHHDIGIQLIKSDANSRIGELSFRALTKFVMQGGSNLWRDWCEANPSQARETFHLFVTQSNSQ